MIYPGRPFKNLISRTIFLFKEWSGRISIILGLIYGVFQYEQAKIDNQVKATLSLYDKFNSVPFTQYRADVMSEINSHENEFVTRTSIPQQFYDYAAKIAKEPKFSLSFNMLLDFFDGVSACVKTEICDPDVADQLFKQRAEEINYYFNGYFDMVHDCKCKDRCNTAYASGLIFIATHTREAGIKAEVRRFIASI